MKALATAIKEYLSLGLSLIPIKPRDKRPAVASWEEWAVCAADTDQWRAWWKEFGGQCGVAVVYSGSATPLGMQLVCVDTDTPEIEAWTQAQALPPTPTVRTANGYHRYFLAPAGLPHYAGSSTRPEVRAGEHYTVLPPSVHPSGAVYEWLLGLAFGEVELAELPEWGVALMRGEQDEAKPRSAATPKTPTERARQYGKSALGREIADLSGMGEGGRNDALNRSAFVLGQLVGGRLLDEQEVRQALIGACYANGLAGSRGGLREVERTLNSGLQKGMAEPRSVPERAPVSVAPPPQPEPTAENLASYEQYASTAVNGLAAPEEAPPGSPALLRDIAGRVTESLEEYRSRPRVVRGLRSGFPSLDNHYLGFSEQQLIVVQGPSGYGKTTFARHAIFATALACLQEGAGACVMAFLLEDTERGLLASYLGYRGVPQCLCEPGSSRYMTPEWEAVLARGYNEFMGLPIVLQTGGREIGSIERQVRAELEKHPLVGVVIDHAQEIEVPGVTHLHEKANQVAARCERLSKQIGLPVMVLSQTTMKDGNFKPEYSDKLRQKSSLCEIITRGNVGCTREQAVQSNIMRVICDKSRWKSAHPVLTLQGEAATGRLLELDNYRASENEGTGHQWPGNE